MQQMPHQAYAVMGIEGSYSTSGYVYRQVNKMAIAAHSLSSFPITFSAAASGDEGTWNAVLADLEQSSGMEVTRVGCFPFGLLRVG